MSTKPEQRSLIRWTVASAVTWGVLFMAVSVWRALAAGQSPLEHAQPVAFMGLIGFTVGGLVGPLARGIASRRGGR